MKLKTYIPTRCTAITGILAAVCGLSGLSGQDFLADFENTSDPFNGAIHTRGQSASGIDLSNLSDGAGPFGTRQLRVTDRSGGDSPSIEWELSSAVSAARFSYDFHVRSADGNTGPILFGVGRQTGNSVSADLNSSSNRLATINLNSSGTALFQAKGASNLSQSFALETILSTTMVINDFDSQSINYISPETGSSALLGPNSVIYYLNGVEIGTSAFSGNVGGVDVGITEGNIGRFGFNGFSGNEGIVSHYDNVSVTNIVPEPSAYALLSGALVFGFATIRRRMR